MSTKRKIVKKNKKSNSKQKKKQDAKRPSIVVNDRQLDDVTFESWAALQRFNKPPQLFRFGGRPARLDTTDSGEIIPSPLRKDEASEVLARSASWYKETDNGRKNTFPPGRVIANVLATPNPPLPILERVVSIPIVAPDGSIRTEPGYDPKARVFVAPGDLKIPKVTKSPKRSEIKEARQLLVDELFGDFPLVDQASVAHLVAVTILPFVRSVIRGPTPMHIVDAPTPGTGKSLAVQTVTRIANDGPVPAMSEVNDGDESRKRVTAGLRESPSFFWIDNVQRPLDSSSLAAALTADFWSDRLLGVSIVVRLPIRCCWAATGNSVSMSNEIARRSVLIRMDAGLEKPWLRPTTSFRHQLPAWAIENRGRFVWACLTLARAWFASGCPKPTTRSLGSFEEWSRVIGGILETAGIEGFLTNLDELYDRITADSSVWRTFLARWWCRFASARTRVADLIEMLNEEEIPVDLAGDTEHARKVALGTMVAKNQDRIFVVPVNVKETLAVKILAATKHGGCMSWKLECCSDLNGGSARLDRSSGRESNQKSDSPTVA